AEPQAFDLNNRSWEIELDADGNFLALNIYDQGGDMIGQLSGNVMISVNGATRIPILSFFAPKDLGNGNLKLASLLTRGDDVRLFADLHKRIVRYQGESTGDPNNGMPVGYISSVIDCGPHGVSLNSFDWRKVWASDYEAKYYTGDTTLPGGETLQVFRAETSKKRDSGDTLYRDAQAQSAVRFEYYDEFGNLRYIAYDDGILARVRYESRFEYGEEILMREKHTDTFRIRGGAFKMGSLEASDFPETVIRQNADRLLSRAYRVGYTAASLVKGRYQEPQKVVRKVVFDYDENGMLLRSDRFDDNGVPSAYSAEECVSILQNSDGLSDLLESARGAQTFEYYMSDGLWMGTVSFMSHQYEIDRIEEAIADMRAQRANIKTLESLRRTLNFLKVNSRQVARLDRKARQAYEDRIRELESQIRDLESAPKLPLKMADKQTRVKLTQLLQRRRDLKRTSRPVAMVTEADRAFDRHREHIRFQRTYSVLGSDILVDSKTGRLKFIGEGSTPPQRLRALISADPGAKAFKIARTFDYDETNYSYVHEAQCRYSPQDGRRAEDSVSFKAYDHLGYLRYTDNEDSRVLVVRDLVTNEELYQVELGLNWELTKKLGHKVFDVPVSLGRKIPGKPGYARKQKLDWAPLLHNGLPVLYKPDDPKAVADPKLVGTKKQVLYYKNGTVFTLHEMSRVESGQLTSGELEKLFEDARTIGINEVYDRFGNLLGQEIENLRVNTLFDDYGFERGRGEL
ncbi:MAG: hypothetical protein WCG06_04570, partial [Candidatus Omnitrophota bacterium]